LARRSPATPGDLLSLAADKSYNDTSFRKELRAEAIRPLIKPRVFAPNDHAHNARIEDELYNQRPFCETMNSVIKRSYGSAVRAQAGIASSEKSVSLLQFISLNKPSDNESHRRLLIQ